MAQSFSELIGMLESAEKFSDRNGTGREIIDLSFRVHDVPGTVFFTSKDRLNDARYVAAQLWWYSKCDQKLGGIENYNPGMWSRFTGPWRSGDDINSNYGEYVFDENQLDTVIERLTEDPMSRRAIILFNRPEVSTSETSDHICTTSLQFLIRNGKLHAIATMRSNELWNGFRYDVAFFTFLMDFVRAELDCGLRLGSYTHNVGSFHVYLNEDEHLCDVQAEALVFPQLRPVEGPVILDLIQDAEEFAKKYGSSEQARHVFKSRTVKPDFKHFELLTDLIFDYEPVTHPRP